MIARTSKSEIHRAGWDLRQELLLQPEAEFFFFQGKISVLLLRFFSGLDEAHPGIEDKLCYLRHLTIDVHHVHEIPSRPDLDQCQAGQAELAQRPIPHSSPSN